MSVWKCLMNKKKKAGTATAVSGLNNVILKVPVDQ